MGFLRNLAAKGFSDASAIPGAQSTQIKIKSPTQAESIAAGLTSNQPKQLSEIDRIKFGDKDMRSLLAEEKLRVAQGLAGGGYGREELVDMLNQPGVQQSDAVMNAYANDERIQAILQAGDENYFDRPATESRNFVGEGQFGRVEELAPGYVVKNQAPLVEFGGYREGSVKGNTIGRIHDYRDVSEEVNQLNFLNNKGITPGVESFIINDDGSTEVIMKDLRSNYQGGEDYYDDLNEMAVKSDKSRDKAVKEARTFELKRKQQEARAAMGGLELQDRHEGNVMRHKMMNRPLQIDPSGRAVQGFDRDAVIGSAVVDGLNSAGLADEAEIFNGLLEDAYNRQDGVAFHDLVQQGASRLMKLKGTVNAPTVADLLQPARDPRMAGQIF